MKQTSESNIWATERRSKLALELREKKRFEPQLNQDSELKTWIKKFRLGWKYFFTLFKGTVFQ